MRLTVHSDPGHGARAQVVLATLVCVALVALLAVGAAACGSDGGGDASPSPSDERVEVPDLETDHVAEKEAKLEIENAGLVPVVETEASAEVPAGGVVRQSPDPGEKVVKGSDVIIAISLGPNMVGLPNFTGMAKKDVVAFLDANRLKGDEVEGQTNKVETGQCYKQKPGAGDQVPEGSTVTYWISSGKPTVKVPDVIGMTPQDAESAIKKGGLVFGGSQKKYSSKVEKGKVMAQSVPAGESVAKGTDVAIVVSRGKHEKTLTVPTCVGQTQKDVVPKLRQAGFQNILVDTVVSEQPTGTIIKQSPPAGTKIHPTERLTLNVSKGSGTLIKVPDCVGEDVRDVKRDLRKLGFTNIHTKNTSSLDPEGEVLKQAPKANAKIHPSDPVVLFVSTGPVVE